MAAYKSLNIDREKIIHTINEKLSPKSIGELIHKGNNLFHLTVVMPDDAKSLIGLYFNNDGTTTISTSLGSNHKQNELIASVIVENCITDKRPSVEVYVCITEKDFHDVIDYLKSECHATIESRTAISGGTQYKIIGKHKDKLIIKYFDKNQSMQVQGKPLLLYSDLVLILCDLLPYEDIVKYQLEVLSIDRDILSVRKELEARIPHVYSSLNDSLMAIITPSIAIRNLEIELEDYSMFVMPVLRGLEGYLKQAFLTCKVCIDKNGFGSYFDKDQITQKFSLKSKYQAAFGVKSSQFVEIYSYYHLRRHQIFHVDSTIITSKLLSKTEATEILGEVLNLMDSNHAILV